MNQKSSFDVSQKKRESIYNFYSICINKIDEMMNGCPDRWVIIDLWTGVCGMKRSGLTWWLSVSENSQIDLKGKVLSLFQGLFLKK